MTRDARPPDRIAALVAALPLRAGLRVLEIGCGPGVAARAVADCIGDGRVVAIDRSAKAIAQAISGGTAGGRIDYRQSDAETFALRDSEAPFDLAFAFRVGALDGRHPEAGKAARAAIRAALKPGGKLYIDGGDPLREVDLSE